jgi:hypothetical protein
MTWAEHLRANGATAEEVTLLDTPAARKAFDATQSAIATATADAETARTKLTNYDKWYNEQALPAYQKMEREKTLAAGEAGRARAVIRAAAEQDESMREVAKTLGYDVDEPPARKKDEPPPVDTSKFLTADQLPPLFEKVGENLAALEDMVMEHASLFGNDPSKRLRVAELRREAVAAGKTINEYWQTKFNVPAARAEQERKAKEAAENAIRADERKKVELEWAAKYANPDTRIAMPSNSPFAPRPAANREKQPWEIGTDGESASGDRVRRATERAMRPN